MRYRVFFVLTMLGIFNNLSAQVDTDTLIEDQCKYIIYGSGTNNELVDTLMIGMAVGINYGVDYKSLTDFAKKANPTQIKKAACYKALNNIYPERFGKLYLTHILIVIDKKFEKKLDEDKK